MNFEITVQFPVHLKQAELEPLITGLAACGGVEAQSKKGVYKVCSRASKAIQLKTLLEHYERHGFAKRINNANLSMMEGFVN